jgi:hypothetical protein
MENRHFQMVMAASKFYDGGIDGDIGPKSLTAMHAVEAKFAQKYTFAATSTPENRRIIAATQACLDMLGHAPGAIDGWMGVNSTEALNAFLFKEVNGKPEAIERAPLPGAAISAASASAANIPHQNDVDAVYGKPGPQIKSRLTIIELPFSLPLDFNMRARTRRITVHRDCAVSLKKALIEVHAHYGPDEMKRLGIERYAGAYNHRLMRGGTKFSMHAYGCAIDFYAEPNGLRMQCPQALFCGPEYQDFLDIMESNEWLPAIRLWGKDAMHFQRARL